MALVLCPECQKVVSTEAVACPQCAFPFPGKNSGQEKTTTSVMEPSEMCADCHAPVGQHTPSCFYGNGRVTENNGSQLQEYTGTEETITTSVLEDTETCPDNHSADFQHASSNTQNDSPESYTNGNHSTQIESEEETWLCPHCRMPYTRKVKPGEEENFSETQEMGKGLQYLKLSEIQDKQGTPTKSDANRVARPRVSRRSPLWQQVQPTTQEEPRSRFSRNSKKPFVVGFLFLVIIAVFGVLGAIWQLKGLNPLEALVYWGM